MRNAMSCLRVARIAARMKVVFLGAVFRERLHCEFVIHVSNYGSDIPLRGFISFGQESNSACSSGVETE